MKVGIRVNGDLELRRKMANVADCAVSGTITRRGLSEVGRIVSRAQKNMAPVRPRNVKRFRSIGKVKTAAGFVRPDGPLRAIKPGLLKRSIGYRVLKLQGNFVVTMGMNVGKKRKNANNAPHAAFVGVGTVQRSVISWRGLPLQGEQANRGIMPQNRFIADATNVAAVAAMAALDKAVKEDTVRAYNLSLRSTRNFAGVNG